MGWWWRGTSGTNLTDAFLAPLKFTEELVNVLMNDFRDYERGKGQNPPHYTLALNGR